MQKCAIAAKYGITVWILGVSDKLPCIRSHMCHKHSAVFLPLIEKVVLNYSYYRNFALQLIQFKKWEWREIDLFTTTLNPDFQWCLFSFQNNNLHTMGYTFSESNNILFFPSGFWRKHLVVDKNGKKCFILLVNVLVTDSMHLCLSPPLWPIMYSCTTFSTSIGN
jgi:hypothetical protein